MMKLLVLVTLLVAVATISAHPPLSDEQKMKMQEVKTQCADELKLSPEDVDKLKVGDVANLNPNHKCFSKCIFEKTGVMTDGKINEAAAIEKVSLFAGPEQATSMVNQCKGVTGADPCEVASKFFECTNKLKQH